MPPPPIPQAEPDKDSSSVKTPRPDISVGIFEDVVVEHLELQGLDIATGTRLLGILQRETTNRGSGKQPEPVLCSEPTWTGSQLRFPFLIVECNSYTARKTCFEAENRVAVSGACALKIQHDLNAIVDVASLRSGVGSHAGDSPLVVSICTQGPFHELCAHYDIIEEGYRRSYMVLIASCCATIHREVVQWLMAVDNLMT